MRQKLLREGSKELSYEIRGIVKKAEQLQALGQNIIWENIGDPIAKGLKVPQWMKDTLKDLIQEDHTFGYCHSKGVPHTRQYLAKKNNELEGAQITADDILFFNGLGDAIAKLYQFLEPTSRIIGPSPAYSTHSSAEAAHANHQPITYKLDPDNHWFPDLDDLYNKVKYNPNIVGILVINPDNPTGMIYPEHILRKILEIAEEFNLIVISDEIYMNITYNGAETKALAEIIGNQPGIALKGISKEFPWPGARCGWMEFYNKEADPQFEALCSTLENAKMIEVCSTKLPQLSIPKIMENPAYQKYLIELREKIGKRSQIIGNLLQDTPGIYFNPTNGAFYNTIIFKEGVLKPHQKLKIEDGKTKELVESWFEKEPEMSLDKRFTYYLLAAKGICVVPISSFCSELSGFRITLLEENEDILKHTFSELNKAINEFIES
ncbi:pyridoxal phosphate-dependent aminotransferase [Aureibacter tunicatorum]|uniref:alanine transaminase n=1 Tax=Aureibacter tunicatorum TaxID=866807 RepID=A0AAE4BR23_9BACT|nr:pyridoxal phosphate-dependent aminotransferase [Aureibacter tunicatorum]MDR6237493.1 aspartate/methionine/tyrosine aminotransferase [Aureibacter tunicatorum]BDD02527.1 aminotransferase [Aureibacter tunicatorum]